MSFPARTYQRIVDLLKKKSTNVHLQHLFISGGHSLRVPEVHRKEEFLRRKSGLLPSCIISFCETTPAKPYTSADVRTPLLLFLRTCCTTLLNSFFFSPLSVWTASSAPKHHFTKFLCLFGFQPYGFHSNSSLQFYKFPNSSSSVLCG